MENRILEMDYTVSCLVTSESDHEAEHDECNRNYKESLSRAKELKARSECRINDLKDIRFQWELFESRYNEMSQWLEKTRSNLLVSLKEKEENSVECVLGKLLKVRELEKKLSEKVSVKDNVLHQAEDVLAKTEAADIHIKSEQLREGWESIENDLYKERYRLESVMKLWKEYNRRQEEIYEWLNQVLAVLRDLKPSKRTLKSVKNQLSDLQVFVRALIVSL